MIYSALLRLLAFSLPTVLASCAKPAYEARGYASYIADQYAGHSTTGGYVYQPQGWTAAHNTLPFGTVVKVKNNYNGRTVNVTVNDRFPYYPNRIINLSRAAAEYIQMPYHRISDVTVTAKTIHAYSAPVAHYSAPPPVYHSPAPARSSHSTAPRKTAYKAPPAKKKTVATKTYHSTPATSSYRKPTAVPPAGYGTSTSMPPPGYSTKSLPAGIPPPPPGYR